MTTKEELIRAVGADAYREACEGLRREAARPDYGGKPTFDSRIPHDLSDLIWHGPPWLPSLGLFFEVYDEMPCYGSLMYVPFHYDDFTDEEKHLWWRFARERLASEDIALANPLVYLLAVDFFGDSRRGEEAWREVSSETAPQRAVRRALNTAAAIPWEWKRRVYERLIDSPEWHLAIFDSLFGSAFDYYRRIDREDACDLLDRLQLPKDAERLDKLRKKLACDERRILRRRKRS